MSFAQSNPNPNPSNPVTDSDDDLYVDPDGNDNPRFNFDANIANPDNILPHPNPSQPDSMDVDNYIASDDPMDHDHPATSPLPEVAETCEIELPHKQSSDKPDVADINEFDGSGLGFEEGDEEDICGQPSTRSMCSRLKLPSYILDAFSRYKPMYMERDVSGRR